MGLKGWLTGLVIGLGLGLAMTPTAVADHGPVWICEGTKCCAPHPSHVFDDLDCLLGVGGGCVTTYADAQGDATVSYALSFLTTAPIEWPGNTLDYVDTTTSNTGAFFSCLV